MIVYFPENDITLFLIATKSCCVYTHFSYYLLLETYGTFFFSVLSFVTPFIFVFRVKLAKIHHLIFP